jgi:hypothetical protein
MAPKHRTPAEQRVWDDLVVRLAPVCVEFRGVEGCAHLVREIADSIISERRKSILEDHK